MDIKFLNDSNYRGFDIYKKEKVTENTSGEKSLKVSGDKLSVSDLDKSIQELNKYLKKDNTYAEYKVHEKLGDIMIRIVDKNSKKIILEFPPEKIIDMIAKFCEEAGIIINNKV